MRCVRRVKARVCFLFFLILPGLHGARPLRPLRSRELVSVPAPVANKMGSGRLQLEISRYLRDPGFAKSQIRQGPLVLIYTEQKPGNAELGRLRDLGVDPLVHTWTPPGPGHPFGFFLAHLPAPAWLQALSEDFVRRVDTASKFCSPVNNTAARAVQADSVWSAGWTGGGVKVAVLDSGIDSEPALSDWPDAFQKKDYSDYPALDDDVENRVTGHGTHVAGSVLGRGVLSSGNTGNGGGAYQGVAPGAELIFLKIGNDVTASASSAAMIGALGDAVDVYGADIITLSYGGWYDYHDGSESVEQKVDWCVSQGTAVFISAGNEASKQRHFSGTAAAGGESDFIRVDVTGAEEDDTILQFNLVWFDGPDRHTLNLRYFDAGYNEITDITRLITTESTRGTESQISYYNEYLDPGNGVYYLKVENDSDQDRFFHVYENLGNGKVRFANADPDYTVSCPSTADSAMSVAAWTHRDAWTDYSGSSWTYGQVADDICSFSSRGPRVDEARKPDIAAPGSAVISLRDRDTAGSPSALCIDSDGSPGGDADYYVMQGTSMACPLTAGAAALLLERNPDWSPSVLYRALRDRARQDTWTGPVPNAVWGYGKLDVWEASRVRLKIKVLLEGPWMADDGAMSTFLNERGLIPLQSPYAGDPRTAGEIPEDAVDWILLRLRTRADSSAVYSRSCFLRKDGVLIDAGSGSDTLFLPVPDGAYYLLAEHRNHLAVMSAAAVSLSSLAVLSFDFTGSADSYYGGADAAKEVEPGIRALFAGDADRSGYVAMPDWNLVIGRRDSIGYLDTDCNLSGIVTVSDANVSFFNRDAASRVPETVE